MNSVSFQGNLTVTTWHKAKSSFKSFPTTEKQDKFIKEIAKNFGEKGEVVPLSKKNANFLYNLVERFTGRKMPRVNNEKVFYNNDDKIVFSDKNPALFDGARVEINF